ncbi:hypothetical protein ARHIZOSPH14_00560 [Agromyces rhizosphaerae]|uniref:Uncharacterized protein n=1 Tax=Agromyces rhizosphaerae TaxID=88374 RepID=A0A9W6FME5_9MICO|nr:hypothetical protein ARHIZOSPH14_00560 [Agromyces rhizosphaerae]
MRVGRVSRGVRAIRAAVEETMRGDAEEMWADAGGPRGGSPIDSYVSHEAVSDDAKPAG